MLKSVSLQMSPFRELEDVEEEKLEHEPSRSFEEINDPFDENAGGEFPTIIQHDTQKPVDPDNSITKDV